MRRGTRGITLIEVLCAVLVLGIAVTAVFRTLEAQTRSTGAMADRVFAHWVAENVIAETRLSGRFPDTADAQLGGVSWDIAVTAAEASFGLLRVEVEVTAPDRPGARLVAFLPGGSEP
ncbi:MAG: type II secretion system minor pseudopilin GspI [Pseudomonadota bacterium]